jgi:hypothetical protein
MTLGGRNGAAAHVHDFLHGDGLFFKMRDKARVVLEVFFKQITRYRVRYAGSSVMPASGATLASHGGETWHRLAKAPEAEADEVAERLPGRHCNRGRVLAGHCEPIGNGALGSIGFAIARHAKPSGAVERRLGARHAAQSIPAKEMPPLPSL